MRRGRRAVRALAIVAVLLVAVLVGVAVLSQTAWFRERLRRLAMRQAEQALDGTLVIGALEGGLYNGVVLRDVRVQQGDVTVVRVARVQVEYGIADLWSDARTVRRITLERPVIEAVRTPAGWNVARLLKPRPEVDPDKPRATFTLPSIGIVDGTVVVREEGGPPTASIPRRLDGLTFDGGVASSPAALSIDVRRLTFRAGRPDLDLRALAGRLEQREDGWHLSSVEATTAASRVGVDGTITHEPDAPWALDLAVTGAPIALPEVARFVPQADFALHPHLRTRVRGTFDRLALDVDVTRSEAGRMTGPIAIDTSGPDTALEGRLTVADVNLAPIVKDPSAAGRITGETAFALSFPSARPGAPVDGTFRFTGPTAEAYGYKASGVTARGSIDGRTVSLDASAAAYGGQVSTRGRLLLAGDERSELALDLAGRVANLDLRRLPSSLGVPVLETSLDGTWAVSGALSTLRAQATLGPSTVEGATLDDGLTARVERLDGGFTFGAAGTVAGLDLQRLGQALDVAALADPQLGGQLTGTFDVSGERRRGQLRLDAKGRLSDATPYGSRLRDVDYTVSLDGDRLEATTDGHLDHVVVEELTGSSAVTGTAAGRVRATVAIADVGAVGLESVGVDASLTLDRATLSDVRFTALSTDVRLEQGRLQVASLDGRGDGFTLTGSGTIGLGDDDASDFRYRLEATSIAEPARVARLPLTGSATTEGRVTGTRADLTIIGTLAGDQLAYGDTVTAATATAQYAVRLPESDASRVQVQASVDAQQVSVGGQALAEIDGTVGYGDETVTFDVRSRDALRTLEARGTLGLEDAGQRLTLDHASVQRDDVAWTLAPGTPLRAFITDRQITLADATLQSGTQRLQVEGTVGITEGAESTLRIEATDVDISSALALAGRTDPVDGRVQLSATVGGTTERPLIDGTVDVVDATVNGVSLERAGGRVTFDGTLAVLDVEVVKDATARLTAKGIVPRTLLDPRADAHVLATPADRLDVAIQSTPIDLALANGLSPYVADLSGQAQLDLRVTGSGRDPHIEGAVFVADGAFVVPITGVAYKNLDAVLTFEEERVVISEMGVETDNGDLLSVQGELGLSREQARTVNLRMQGRDVRVLDNELGLLDLDVDLTIGGTLIAPSVEGSISVSDGRLELDEILPQFTDTAYATQAEYRGIPTERLRGAVVPDLLGEDDRVPRLQAGSNRFTLAEPVSTPPGAEGATTADGATTAAPASAPPAPSVFAGTALNVQVRLPDNLVVRGQGIEAARASVGDVNATLGGEFRVAKTAGKPVVLLGAINTVRGTYAYQGRRFDLVRDGQIQFRGSEEIDPRLDITAQRVIQGVEARVRIQGTARDPELSLTSTPPLDEGDILALIVFNQPLNQLGTGQQNTLAQRAGGIAAGFVVSPLAEALGSTLDLDQFDVETTDPSGRVNPAVVIGQQVTQDLFLRFRQQFGNQQVSQFLLEYRLANFLRLQANVAEGDGLTAGNRSLTQRIERYGLDLVFYWSF